MIPFLSLKPMVARGGFRYSVEQMAHRADVNHDSQTHLPVWWRYNGSDGTVTPCTSRGIVEHMKARVSK